MNSLIFILSVYSQIRNSSLHVEVSCLLTCLKVRVSFVFVILFACLFSCFSSFGRSCKFFPKNLSTFHFTPSSMNECKCIFSFHLHHYMPRHIAFIPSISVISLHEQLHVIPRFHVITHCISSFACNYM